jgi:hypothetical protein
LICNPTRVPVDHPTIANRLWDRARKITIEKKEEHQG